MSDVALWEEKARRAGARITDLISQDAAHWFTRAIREAFVAADETDALSDAEVAELKAAASARAAGLADGVRAGLEPCAWAELIPEGERLEAIAPVAAAMAAIGSAPAGFADAWPALAQVEWPAYALPRRFIDGHDLVSLGRELFKALGQIQTLRAEAAAAHTQRTTAQRRQRWDDA